MIQYSKLQGVPELTQESALRAELGNGSRIVALPGSERTVRGYTGARLIVLDEAARVDDALLAALRPSMAVVNGSLIMLSTPFGKRGEFFRAWSEGQGWTRVSVPASACPRISQEFLDDERRELGAMRYSEEYELAWLEDTEAVFPVAIVDRAFTDKIQPLWR
jgi:hypothetical protein